MGNWFKKLFGGKKQEDEKNSPVEPAKSEEKPESTDEETGGQN
ncbi:MAG: hypothetical protein ABIC36_02805 [bacterium]